MLNVGGFPSRDCSGVSRRAFVKIGTSAVAGLGLNSIVAEAAPESSQHVKSVIIVWLWGAPSHLDTFDPKPDAPAEYRGPFSAISTRTPGVQVSELFPLLAQQSDKYAIVRGMKTFNGGHPGAGTWGLTGFDENPEPVQPNFGSIVAKHTLQNHGPAELPPFFYVGRGIPRDLPRRIKGYGGGRIGQQYDPFLVNCQADGSIELPALDLLDGLSPSRMDDRRALLNVIDGARRRIDLAGFATWDRTYQTAYGLLTQPETRAAFDLSREPDSVRARYGGTSFGQSCLLARRLAQSHVPYIQVNWSEYVEAMSPGCDFGWDTHIYNFELLQDRHGPILDRAFSALLEDLEQQGLLESTLVVAMGEFGRTPKLNARAARDHWPNCYFSLWAGGGVQGGQVIGESDKLANEPLTPPITPLMVGTTLCERSGIDVQARSEMDVLTDGQVIPQLFS